MTTLEERFWSKVDRAGGPDACWLWRGSTNKSAKSRSNNLPYGHFKGKGGRKAKMLAAHRFAYEMANGPIPEGFIIRHTCDVSLCCNPTHLCVGTHKDNKRDAMVRGRAYINVNGRRGGPRERTTQL